MNSQNGTDVRAPGDRPRGGLLQRLGEWCARHFVVVIVAWLVALGGLHGLQGAFGGAYSDNFSLPGTQSDEGARVLGAHAPGSGGIGAQVVLHDGRKSLAAVQSQIDETVGSLQRLPHVLSAESPLPATPSSPPTGALTADGKTGYITVRFDGNPTAFGDSYLRGVDRAVEPLRAAGVEVEYGGPLGELARPKPTDLTSEAIGFAVAVVVLLIGFGSVIAAMVPLLTALIGVVVGLSCLSLIAAATTFASVSPTLATMIGLGVGIDYALFLITRHRQQVMDGADPVTAAGRAVATSGRAVLVSGCTVIVALAGLYVSQVSFIGKLGAAAAVTVVTAVSRRDHAGRRPCSDSSDAASTATGSDGLSRRAVRNRPRTVRNRRRTRAVRGQAVRNRRRTRAVRGRAVRGRARAPRSRARAVRGSPPRRTEGGIATPGGCSAVPGGSCSPDS